MSKPTFREAVAEEMIRQIEAGTTPWQKPWTPGVVRSAPFNPTSDKNYRGINTWWLELQGRADPRWMTYRQALAQGAHVRKGEKGTSVEYWKWTDTKPLLEADGKPVLDDDGKAKRVEVRLDRPKVFYATVFNAEQIDGLEPFRTREPGWKPDEKAEEVLRNGSVPILHDQSDRAFYNPVEDRVHMPARAAFKESYEYYATSLHELGHATGHRSRLARDFGPFGSATYAKEELRAEMASFMVATEIGLGHYPERHSGYVDSWLKALKEDRNVLFQAARDAEIIRTWIMEPELRQSLTPVREQARSVSLASPPSRQQATPEIDNPVEAIAIRAGLDDAPKLGTLYREMQRIDWYHDYSEDPAVRRREGEYMRHTLDQARYRSRGSRLAAELVSVAFDDVVPQDYQDRPQWYVRADNRQLLADIDLRKPEHALATFSERFGDYQSRERSLADLIDATLAEMPERSHERFYEQLHTVIGRPTSILNLAEDGQLDPKAAARTLLHDARTHDGARQVIHAATVNADWIGIAARHLGLENGDRLRETVETFSRIDWFPHYADTIAGRKAGEREQAAFRAKLDELAGLSPQHRELLSAMWDHKAEREVPQPGWYLPANTRRNELTRDLSGDPVQALKSVHLPQRQEEQAMSPAKESERKRVYLAVPFSEKDRAKALGAKWDRRAKAWYAPEGADPDTFARWKDAPSPSPDRPIPPAEEFAEACHRHGLLLKGQPVMDGRWHRVMVDSDAKGQMSGSYRGFLDGRPSGQIMNYRLGDKAVKWVATGNKPEPEELERLKAEAARRNAKLLEDIRARQRKTAKRAFGIFENAKPAPADHAYLANKQVPAHDLKVDDKGNLLVPMRDTKGFLMNVQTIKPDGAKRFLKDGRKQGLMHVIKGSDTGPTIVAEGYATAASLHAATGRTVAVAFDAGNLEAVGHALKRTEPDRPLVFAADDDHTAKPDADPAKHRNTGLASARAAALATGGTVIEPGLMPDEKAKGMTDFNDIARSRGTKALADVLDKAITPEKPKAKARAPQAREMGPRL